MSNNLIIVESYTKTKTIYKYLNDSNNKYIVTFSQGHFCDLSKDNIGIDTNTWKGNYIVTKKSILNNIRKYINDVDNIYIASDPDTEGEAIAFHIKNHIKDLIKNKNCYRIKFNEITKNAILNAIDNPLDIDMNLVEAQETRRFLDRIVGYKLSPILWNKFNNKFLSVGRVQSVALLFCINQLNEINNHNIEKFWILSGKFKLDNDIKLDCTSIKIDNENNIINILNLLDDKSNIFKLNFNISNYNDFPLPPYCTTSLQQDSYNLLKFSSKKTMEIAQKLYENGYITYMRTDSVNISDDFKYKLKKYIIENYGNDLFVFRNFKNKIINSQLAHEAIRITNPKLINIKQSDEINDNHIKLYNLIWKRTISSQMKEAIYTKINIEIKSKKCLEYIFKTEKSFLTEKGYLIIYNKEIEDYKIFYNLLKNNKNIKPISFSFNCDINQPKSLYNEVALIKKLEKEGIGRPSTYATIIDKLYTKKYVIKGTNPQIKIDIKNYNKKHLKDIEITNKTIKTGGKNNDLLVPTDLGINIINYLNDIIPFIININFTADMEYGLDEISNGKIKKENILNEFYNKIKPIINNYGIINNTNSNSIKKEGIINTKYGYCYYHEKDNRYVNIESYLQWKKKSVEQLESNEIIFLKSLPFKLDNGNTLHIGKYGLYLKDQNNTNIKLDKKLWNDFI